MKVLDQS